jgi:hypothetical protein
VRAEDHIDMWQLLEQAFAVALADAPAHRDGLAPSACGLHALQRGDLTAKPFVGVLPDAAGHEDDDVGVSPAPSTGVQALQRATAPLTRSESCLFIWHPKVRIRYVCPMAGRV